MIPYKDREIILTEDGTYLMCLPAHMKGGPIVTGKTFEECDKSFNEAMMICIVIKKILNFNDNGYWDIEKT